MDTSLKLYYVANDGTDRAFPEGNYEQAELHDFTVNKTRMGNAPTITATLEYPYCLDDEWGRVCHFDDVYVVFNNERYYLKATPPSSKSNDKLFYKHNLTFVSERSVLETTYMIDDLENQTQNIILSNNTQIIFFGGITQFVERINQSMYFSGIGDTCVYDGGELVPIEDREPNGDGFYVVVDSTVTNADEMLVTLSNNSIADALKQFLEKWGVPYYFIGRTIHVGDYEVVTDADYAVGGVLGAEVNNGALVPYEYGQPNSVLQVSSTNSTKQIYNRCSGTGSSDNIPYYYPNPTPSGTIHHIVEEMQGSTLTSSSIRVDSYLKFSNLDESDALVYTQKLVDITGELGKKSFYFNGRQVFFAYSNLTGESKPQTQELTFDYTYEDIFDQEDYVYVRYYYLKPTSATLMVKVTLVKPFNMLNMPFDTECTSDVDWVFFNDNSTVYMTGSGRGFEYSGEALAPGVYYLSFVKNYIPSTQQAITEESFNQLKSTQISIEELVGDANDWVGNYGQDQRYWALLSSGKRVNLSDYGLSLLFGTTVVDGDMIKKVVDKWVVPQEKLMPSCYRLSDGKKKFYPALNYPLSVSGYLPDADIGDVVNGNEIDNENYYDNGNQYYNFENPYRRLKQKEHIYDFQDIKPTIEGMMNEGNARIDMFEKFAYDLNDDNSGYFDEQGNWNFNHPYFFALMRPSDSFNLFDHAIDESKMTISFTSGSCAPCEFEIAVDKDTQKNLVQTDATTVDGLARDEDGDVICGRKTPVVPQDGSQQETKNTWTWIALKKDVSTFGESNVVPFNDGVVSIRPRPCSDYNENDGDTFVILHIEMPQAYVEAAEQRLTKEIIKQMNADNAEKFKKSLKYSKVYLGENQDLVDILNENVKVQARYNGITKSYFVSSYSYRVQETSPIPEINIDGLVETVEELKMMASAGGSFTQKIGEHISENFAELMMGFNKPFTRVINQNNTQVLNQAKNDFPKDYVITQDELMEDAIVTGAGGRFVQRLNPGKSGQVLMLSGSKPKWSDYGLDGYTAFLQSNVAIASIATEIVEFRSTLQPGKYIMSVGINIGPNSLIGGSNTTGMVTAFAIYMKHIVCSGQTFVNSVGRIELTTVVDITDASEAIGLFVISDTNSSNNFAVSSSVTNNSGVYENSSSISFIKIS